MYYRIAATIKAAAEAASASNGSTSKGKEEEKQPNGVAVQAE